jgi:hypothetical protein
VSFFEREYPGYTFIWDGALEHHDHPVSHLARELNEIEMTDDLTRRGEQYIDLFGDGRRNYRYKRNCVTLFQKKTAKDYIRYQKLEPNMFELKQLDDLWDAKHPFGKIDTICMTHSLYYLPIEVISRIVNVRSTRRIRALVHRHPETSGTLNSGEQKYWVNQNLIVTQMNVQTGEKYHHPSLEGMFHQSSAQTAYGGVAWTIKKSGGDSYIIDIVGCPNEVAEEYVPLRYFKQESWEKYTYNSLTVKKFLRWTWLSASTSAGEVVLEDIDLFNKLRRYVAGKKRDPRLKIELMNHARRLTNKADIISIHGGGAHDVPVATMSEYVEVAFYVDQKKELDAALSFYRENRTITSALNEYYEKGSVPRDFTVVTGAAVHSAKTFSEHAIGIMQAVRDSQFMTAADYIKAELPGDELAHALFNTEGADAMVPGLWWA